MLVDRAATKLGAGLRSRQGLTPAAQNVGSAAGRAQRAFGAGLKSSQENVKPLGKPTDLKKQVWYDARMCCCNAFKF